MRKFRLWLAGKLAPSHSEMAEALSSAISVSVALDKKVLTGEASALDAKYAGDKAGWLYRQMGHGQPPVKVAGTLTVPSTTNVMYATKEGGTFSWDGTTLRKVG